MKKPWKYYATSTSQLLPDSIPPKQCVVYIRPQAEKKQLTPFELMLKNQWKEMLREYSEGRYGFFL